MSVALAVTLWVAATGPLPFGRGPTPEPSADGPTAVAAPAVRTTPDLSPDECEPPDEPREVTELDPLATPAGRCGPPTLTVGPLPAAFWPPTLLASSLRPVLPYLFGPQGGRPGHFLSAARLLRTWVPSLVC